MRIRLKKIAVSIFAIINLFVVAAMNVCAYSVVLPPQKFPNWSYFGLAFPAFLLASLAFIIFWIVFKWKYTAISVVGMLLCCASIRTYCPINFSSDPPEGSLKILSYNILNLEGLNREKLEENPTINYILDFDADIVCLQEAGHINDEDIRAILQQKYTYISYEEERNTSNVCMSKYPILNCTKIDFPSTSNASFAYEILVGEDSILVINNHLESYKLNSEEKQKYKDLIKRPEDSDIEGSYDELTDKLAAANSLRGMQADSIRTFIERNNRKYIIVCGDFNDCSISYTHHTLTKLLNDAYTRSGNGPGLSYNRSGMYFRIDNILISPSFKPYKAKVDNSIESSDHYPISCYLEMKKDSDAE